ncbi:integrase arm-type DNA-binding domain-containing protein [Methylovirgula sp. HY1]|uniref:tyrosine-type recombinase/integrase n=1 Tax=Methylovirgula sp. HY1 TaxID=2822761 RepID=UPI001C5AA87D|nr:integrase arm-type DNA-binding domain-containing protein [Methylovirgula sp. HY1]QXX74281.1 Prophage integrase IntA [Methylovirgula sp. HY1]
MPLSELQIRRAKPAEKPFKLADGHGLHVLVTPAGGKLWRLRFDFAGKEKLLSIGPYPDIGLAAAREAAQAAKKLLREGKDPTVEKRLQRLSVASVAGLSFEEVARDWHERQKPRWTERHARDVIISLERNIFPQLGRVPIAQVTPPALLGALRIIEGRAAIETAARVRQRIEAIFDYAGALGVVTDNPAKTVANALKPITRGKQPAIVELAGAREVLAKAEAIPAHPVTRLALRFLALTVVRPGDVRGALWSEIEGLGGPSPQWVIPAARMKMRRDHIAPLSAQAVAVLEVLKPLSGYGALIFPSTRAAHRPLSENAIGYLLNRAGYHQRHVPHGWRATFSTVMNERFRGDRAVIDLMLAHVKGDKTEAAYNRALHLDRRRELAQIWADLLLDGAPAPAALIDQPRR